MTDLTEKFKKHELPQGLYYAQMPNGSVEILSDYALCRYALAKDGNKIKILSAVLTYEEFKAIQERIADQRAELESVRWYQTVQNEDIIKLRGLLKEILPIVSAEIMTWQIRGGEEARKRGKELLTNIKEVLR